MKLTSCTPFYAIIEPNANQQGAPFTVTPPKGTTFGTDGWGGRTLFYHGGGNALYLFDGVTDFLTKDPAECRLERFVFFRPLDGSYLRVTDKNTRDERTFDAPKGLCWSFLPEDATSFWFIAKGALASIDNMGRKLQDGGHLHLVEDYDATAQIENGTTGRYKTNGLMVFLKPVADADRI